MVNYKPAGEEEIYGQGWMARNITTQEALRPIILEDFVISLTGLSVAIWDAFAGAGNALRWATVVIYLFLALGCAYFQFVASPSSRIATQQ